MNLSARDDAQLSAAIGHLTATLDDKLIAIYHYGSALLGALQANSDLDLFVAIDRPTTPLERSTLAMGLMAISGASGTDLSGRPLEVTVVRSDQLRPVRAEPEMDFLYGEWLRDEFARGLDAEPRANPDLLVVAATVLSGSTVLFGPEPSAVIDPVPTELLEAGMRASVPDLLEDLEHGDFNVLLTLARMVYTVAEQSITTKDAAADWVLARLAPELRPPLAHARSIYLGELPITAPFPPGLERTAAALVERVRASGEMSEASSRTSEGLAARARIDDISHLGSEI